MKKILAIFSAGITTAFMMYSSFMAPPKTQAWTGDLPSCNANAALDWEWKQKIKQKWGESYNVDTWAYAVLIGSFDTEGVYPSGYTGSKYALGLYFGTGITFNQTGTSKSVTINNAQHLQISKDPDHANWLNDITPSSPPTPSTTTVSSFACIDVAHGATYASSWTGKYFSHTLPQEEVECEGNFFEKLGCNVQNTFQGVAETLVDVGQAIVRGIARIFIPDESNMNDIYEEAKIFFETKLGFLIYPVTFVDNMITAYNSGTSVPEPVTGEIFGSTFTVDFTALQDINSSLWTLVVTFIRIGVVILLMFGIIRELKAVLGVKNDGD